MTAGPSPTGPAASTTPPTVSVVICTRDRPDLLDQALGHAMAALRPGDELVVVDSASRDRRTREVAERHGARYARCDEPGLSRARNLGIAQARNPVVAFTDDDCRPAPDWVQRVSETFAAHPRVGMVTGQVPIAPGSEGPALSVLMDTTEVEWDEPTVGVCLGHGANMALRAEAVAAVGDFDVLLGAGGPFHSAEDTDWQLRLLDSGWTIRHQPSAVVEHVMFRGRREALRVWWGYGVGRGAMTAKWLRQRPDYGRRLRKQALWEEGVLTIGRLVRARYEFGVVATGVFVVGLLRGLAAGRRLGLAAGLFVVPSARPPR